MNFHAPLATPVATNVAMPKGVPARDLLVRIGAVIEYGDVVLPSGENFNGGVELVTAIRPGEIRLKDRGWVPADEVKQVLWGFTAGDNDTRYEPDDETILALYDRAAKTEETRRSMTREMDEAYDRYRRVCAGRGIADTGPDGRLVQPRERLLEVRRLQGEVMKETGYEEVSDRAGRLDMHAAMLRTAILMMPVNTPKGGAAKLETLLRDYEGSELDERYEEQQRAILSELRQMDAPNVRNSDDQAGEHEIQLPTDVDQIPISSLYIAAQALETASDILGHMADMGVIEDRRAGFFMEEVGNTVRTAWTRLLEHIHGRNPTDASEAALRKFMIASARLNCSNFTDDLDVTGSRLTSWLAEPATEQKAA